MIDARTGARWPIWVEIDSSAKTPQRRRWRSTPPSTSRPASLHRRPAKPQERRRESLKRRPPSATTATKCPPNRKRSTPGVRTSKRSSRRSKAPGIARSSLYLAWDFTVASDAEQQRARALDAQRRFRPARATPTSPTACRRAARRRLQSPASKTNRTRDRSPGGSRARSRFPASCSPILRAGRDDASGRGREPDPERHSGRRTSTASSPLSATSGPAGAARPALYGHGLLGRRLGGRLGPTTQPLPGIQDRPMRDR